MAVCQDCGQEMTLKATKSCKKQAFRFPGGERPRLAYDGNCGKRCGDCNVAIGGYHHLGCDQEICPSCGSQVISCGCWSVKNRKRKEAK
jgi:rRNA maturation endonuclease Nob1